jgi:hypothetical protein
VIDIDRVCAPPDIDDRADVDVIVEDIVRNDAAAGADDAVETVVKMRDVADAKTRSKRPMRLVDLLGESRVCVCACVRVCVCA